MSRRCGSRSDSRRVVAGSTETVWTRPNTPKASTRWLVAWTRGSPVDAGSFRRSFGWPNDRVYVATLLHRLPPISPFVAVRSSLTGRKENVHEHPPVRRARPTPGASETPRGAGRQRPEPDRRRDHAFRRFHGLRLRLDRLVRAVDRAAGGEVPLRPADDDRLARGDLPVHVRDDQPEPGGREASGLGGQPVEDRPVRRSPERSVDRAVEADPGADEGDPLLRGRPAGPGARARVRVSRGRRRGSAGASARLPSRFRRAGGRSPRPDPSLSGRR